LDIVGLDANIVRHLYPDELSGGMKKRVGLARTLSLNPKIILYDEPTSGLDPITSDLISQLIIKLQNDFKTTSILITHDMKEAFKCADYLAMLYDGEIIAYDSKDRFKNIDNPIIQKFIEI
jgi:phospholipid/cholesterol/gamma-HCH transport system ATP-binding protein